MNVLSIGHSEDGGGAQTVFRINNSLGDDQLNIITAFESSNHSTPDIKLVTIKSFKSIWKKILGYFYIKNNYNKLKKFLLENDVDIIHIHHATTLSLSLMVVLKKYKRNSKIIFTSHGYGLTCPIYSSYNFSKQKICNKCSINNDLNVVIGKCDKRGRLFSIARYIDFKLQKLITNNYSLYDLIIVPSEYLKETIINSKYQFKDVKVVPNPISNDFTNRALGFKKKKNIFTFAGRFSEEKNVLLLIEAFSILLEKYNDIHLNIIGDGSLKVDYLEKINLYGIEGKITLSDGFISQGDLYNKLNESKFIVLPTKSPETFGLSIYEGMLLGNMPIVANIGAQKEILKELEIGYLFENNDLNSLVRMMEEALFNYNEDEKKLEIIRDIIEVEFSYEKYKKGVLKVYEEAIARKVEK